MNNLWEVSAGLSLLPSHPHVLYVFPHFTSFRNLDFTVHILVGNGSAATITRSPERCRRDKRRLEATPGNPRGPSGIVLAPEDY